MIASGKPLLPPSGSSQAEYNSDNHHHSADPLQSGAINAIHRIPARMAGARRPSHTEQRGRQNSGIEHSGSRAQLPIADEYCTQSTNQHQKPTDLQNVGISNGGNGESAPVFYREAANSSKTHDVGNEHQSHHASQPTVPERRGLHMDQRLKNTSSAHDAKQMYHAHHRNTVPSEGQHKISVDRTQPVDESIGAPGFYAKPVNHPALALKADSDRRAHIDPRNPGQNSTNLHSSVPIITERKELHIKRLEPDNRSDGQHETQPQIEPITGGRLSHDIYQPHGANTVHQINRVPAPGAPLQKASTWAQGAMQNPSISQGPEYSFSVRGEPDNENEAARKMNLNYERESAPVENEQIATWQVAEGHALSDLSREELERRLRDAIQTEREYSSEIHRLHQQQTDMKKRWEGAVDALVRFRQESSSMMDDESLRKMYKDILFRVQHWVEDYCHSQPMPNLSRQNKGYLKSLTPAYRDYLVNKTDRRLLVQSLLMNWLSSEVLTFDRDTGLWWAGTLCEGLTILCKQLEPAKSYLIPHYLEQGSLQPADVREYASWKARTAHLVSKTANRQHIEGHVTSVVAGLVKAVTPFVATNLKNDAEIELRGIIRQTFALDEELCKSRALFTAHCWNDRTVAGMRFDSNIMEAAQGSNAPHPGMTVDLILAPALSKTGTADGDSYERNMYICKWIVVCSEASRIAG
ncbi:hypothetical protein GQ44DRAFT_826422 [Phaeosphaeriaceae sp. PMI808]|nr:hypothetical protein GQ44DRAFT_826422 [Phaeosphaeriaceae sp. PMI808]